MKGIIRQVYVEIELEDGRFILIPRPALACEVVFDAQVQSQDNGFSFQFVEK